MGSNYMSSVEGSSMGSSGVTSDSLNGLKFGQKIYFEDHVVGVGDVSSGKSSKNSKSNKNNIMNNNNNNNNGKGVVQNGHGQAPRCQVEGCKTDLSDAKAYYSRHKVCGMHSKSPVVIVAGLQQRFCQQCSRFHQLPEFDQGKRSCRRRLAGHNERRRKPPPGSLLSSRLGRLSSSLFGDNISGSGGFLLDFSSYARQSESDLWPSSKTSEGMSGNQLTSPGKFQHNLWPGNSQDHPSEMYLQGSAGCTSFSIPSGECHTGVSSDSSCALSLLSNQTWGSRNGASGTGLGSLMNTGGASMSQCVMTDTVTVAQFPSSNSSWNFKDSEPDAGLHAAVSDHLGLGQASQPLSGQFHNDLFMDQIHGSGRHYMEVDHSRGYSSADAGHLHWSL